MRCSALVASMSRPVVKFLSKGGGGGGEGGGEGGGDGGGE